MSVLVFLFLLGAVSAAAGVEMRHELNRKAGDFVIFPGVKFDATGSSWWELKRRDWNPDWLAQYHGGPAQHDVYKHRLQIIHNNGTIRLNNLTVGDSGQYEIWMNNELQGIFILHVLEAVPKPDLWIQDIGNETYQVLLECKGSGGSPTNMSFWKDGVEIKGNVTVKGNVSVLACKVNRCQSWGEYTCQQWNLVSRETSDPVLVLSPVNNTELTCFYAIIVGLVFLLIRIFYIICNCAHRNDTNMGNPAVHTTILYGDSILGIMSIIPALLITIYGLWLSSSWRWVIVSLLVIFLLIKIAHCIMSHLQKRNFTHTRSSEDPTASPGVQTSHSPIRCKDTKSRISGTPVLGVVRFCARIIDIIDWLIMPGYLILHLVKFLYDNLSCGKMVITDWPMYLAIFIPLVFGILLTLCIYIMIKSCQCDVEDGGQPGKTADCRNLQSESHENIPFVEVSSKSGPFDGVAEEHPSTEGRLTQAPEEKEEPNSNDLRVKCQEAAGYPAAKG